MPKDQPSFAKEVNQTFRDSHKLIKQVGRHLIRQQLAGNERRSDCIHPSEAANKFWCSRATYYRITGVDAKAAIHRLPMSVVFDQGHEAHNKWQTWFWEMGVLSGNWECIQCGYHWEGTSPTECPTCHSPGIYLRYREVSADQEEYLIHGHADGQIGDGLIEIKTIGEGTIRHDAPRLVDRYSYVHKDVDGKKHSGVDWKALWANIHRPFAAHLRQGMLYCFSTGLEKITFIYEPKFIVSEPKEFLVRYQSNLIEDVLERCLNLKASLQKGYPPRRPMWANISHKVCTECVYKEVCYARRNN